MNIVALVGNVASKPELRETSTGKSCCTFRLAVSRIGGAQADFLTVVTWERQAEVCAEYMDIGQRIGVEGRLRHTTWRTDDDKPRSRVEVVANRVELMNKSNRDRNEPERVHPYDEAAAEEAASAEHTDSIADDEVFTFDSGTSNDVFERVAEPV